jgi:hypothetical protein
MMESVRAPCRGNSSVDTRCFESAAIRQLRPSAGQAWGELSPGNSAIANVRQSELAATTVSGGYD